MTNVNNDILFRRTVSVVVPAVKGGSNMNVTLFSTALRELANLGYRPSETLLKAVTDSTNPVGFLAEVINIVSKAVGANYEYVPMYPNFPKQVMKASDAELYFNAIVHYFGAWLGVRIMPEYEVKDRKPLDAPEFSELKEIGLATEQDFLDIFSRLLSSKTSWSATDQEDVDWFLLSGIAGVKFGKVPNKENLAYLAKSGVVDRKTLLSLAATATDVLRLAVVWSGGDPALNGVGVEKVTFKSPPRAARRDIVARLNEFPNLTEDALRNLALWKLFFHSLHVGEFARKYPRVAQAAKVVRNNGRGFTTFNGMVENALNTGNISYAAVLLSERPGDFARRLDKVLREAHGHSVNRVLDLFNEAAPKVSTPVLWQLRSFYENRALVAGKRPQLSRVFMPKGRATKMLEATNPLPPLDEKVTTKVLDIINRSILENYSDKMLDGDVFIAPELFDCTIPFGARSASKSLNPVGRGTRVSLGDEKTVRLFIHWKDQDRGGYGGRVDVDLSAYAIDEEFANSSTIAYYDLRQGWGVHSGDITSAPDGAAEFIDIDKKAAIAAGHRYIAMSIISYSGQTFDTVPELFAGVMERKKKQSGEIFEPRTVKNAFDVTAPSTSAIPFVIDLVENVMIWSDLAVGRNSMYSNVQSSQSPMLRSIKGIVQTNQPTLGDLLAAHSTSLVANTDEAAHVFEFHRGRVLYNSKPVGQEEILAEWL